MAYILKTGSSALAVAGLFGGVKEMLNERKEFLRKNVATTYESQHLAKVS